MIIAHVNGGLGTSSSNMRQVGRWPTGLASHLALTFVILTGILPMTFPLNTSTSISSIPTIDTYRHHNMTIRLAI